MGRRFKRVMKRTPLREFLAGSAEIGKLKYKTIEKETEIVHHYGWHNVHLYSKGIYLLQDGREIMFDYCYEMNPNPKESKNISNVIL